jgi:hypothetical protein
VEFYGDAMFVEGKLWFRPERQTVFATPTEDERTYRRPYADYINEGARQAVEIKWRDFAGEQRLSVGGAEWRVLSAIGSLSGMPQWRSETAQVRSRSRGDPEKVTMTDNVVSHPRRATLLRRQITNGAVGLRLQKQICMAVDDFYKFLNRHGFFQDEDERRYLGIALVISCDTIGDMEITINDVREW